MEKTVFKKHYRRMVPKAKYKPTIPGLTHEEIMARISEKRGYHKRSQICKKCGLKVEIGEPRHRTKSSLYHQQCYEATQIGGD
jgi:hypothetical protein